VCDLPCYTPTEPRTHLRVTVYSFSFKKGLPTDDSGNGGGYIFDCRATHNPGKYDEYKQLTGLDAPVKDFLEKDGEILTFLDHAYALVDSSVERYLERGFTNLQVSFGCTGGQHRSVYSAQAMAEHLHNKYNVEVLLIHRERHITQLYSAR
jgi:RNase adaptor protein for sRNA GlmZ degradation